MLASKLNIVDSKGFTLIELIAVMAILSIVTALTVKKVVAISYTAEQNALIQGLAELNAREKLTWTKIKLADDGYQYDDAVWDEIDLNLGEQYSWKNPPKKNGGTLSFGSQSIALKRTGSNTDTAGSWSSL
jgi:prepilin-type N-terminal cleavage/methylation domain-containing protein